MQNKKYILFIYFFKQFINWHEHVNKKLFYYFKVWPIWIIYFPIFSVACLNCCHIFSILRWFFQEMQVQRTKLLLYVFAWDAPVVMLHCFSNAFHNICVRLDWVLSIRLVIALEHFLPDVHAGVLLSDNHHQLEN